MKITTGYTASVRAQNQVRRTTNAIAASLQRLSTGQRVTGWNEDSATLAMAQKLDAQTRGLTQATLNVNQSMGMISTAEGAISTQIEIINRMREIAVQSSNGTVSTQVRSDLNDEMQQLYEEFTRLTMDTEFNGTKLLDGSFTQTQLQISSGPNNNLNTPYLNLPDLSASTTFVKTIGTGAFKTRTTFDLGSPGSLWDSEEADLNGDGFLDIVAADRSNSTINITLGNGDGTFQSARTYSTQAGARGLSIGDVNGDGVNDIVTADIGSSTISIFIGNGDGTFQTRITKTVGTSPRGVAMGDFNEDGYMDLAVTNSGSASVSVLTGNGTGTFTSYATLTTGTTPYKIVSGDFNNDGNLDLAVTNGGSTTMSVFIGAGNGSFAAKVDKATGTTPFGITSGDFNGDGFIDLATTNSGTTTTSVFLNNRDGTFANQVTYTVGSTSVNLESKDVNGDEIIDLIVGNNGSNSFSVLTGVGDGTFNTQKTYSSTGVYGISVGDFDGDGVDDIVAADSTGLVGSFHAGATQIASAVADIDVTTQSNAQDLIDILDNTLNRLKGEQATLAGLHSRLDIIAAGNLLMSETYADAKSLSLDTDVALETANLVRNQMLLDAQAAVLAQANVQMQVVQQLLRYA